MENNPSELSNHQDHHQTIDLIRLSVLERKLTSQPSLLSQTAGSPTCSIFKIPQSFIDVNGKLYQPQIVSIGPFHHGKPQLQIIQEHKYRYIHLLLSRLNSDTTNNKQLTLSDLFNSIQSLEPKARQSYSENIPLDSHDFLEIMVVDGCFMLELFRKVAKTVSFEPDDPIHSMSWIFSFLLRDLLKLENQIPFFILQTLFDITRSESDKSLTYLCLYFFSYTVERLSNVIHSLEQLQGQHLLDLLRTSFIPDEFNSKTRGLSRPYTPSHIIHSITKLRRAGIKLRNPQNRSSATSFLSVKFKRGILEMPLVTIDDFMSCFFANCVAYEISHKNCSTYITTYATLLDCLVNTSKDVEYLCDHNIIENYFGTDSEVATFLNNLGKDVTFDINRCYLAYMFNEVNDYCRNSWHVYWASFKFTYFKTPWSFVSALAALVLLILTVLQTLYTMLPYYQGGS